MAQAHVQAALTGVFALPGRSAEQTGTCAHRLVVLTGLKQAVIERPPVVNQCGQTRGVLTGV